MKTMKMNKLMAAMLATAAITAAGTASAATYTMTGSSEASFSGLALPLTVTSGTYDDATGVGNWSLNIDLAVFEQPVMTVVQDWTMDSATGTGTLGLPTSCTGAPASTCSAVGSSFQGAWSATPTPVGAGDYVFLLPGTQAGDVAFDVTLVADAVVEPPSEVPVPAAAWLFGSALLGLAGVQRRRKA